MTSCSNARENINAYIDDELNMDERRSFEKHIGKCKECKAELDEMRRIAELCRELPQQEPPAEFKAELHEKLLAVAAEQDGNVGSGKKPKSFFLTKTFASVAAGILLIFLAGSFYRLGFLSPVRTKSTADNAAMAAGQPAAKGSEDIMGMQSDGGETEEAGVAGNELRSFNATAEVDSKCLDVNRSGTIKERESAFAGAMEMQGVEAASNKVSTITITAEDPEALAEEVKALALENSGDIKEEYSNGAGDGRVTSYFSETAPLADKSASKGSADDSLSQDSIRFAIPETQYDNFVTELNSAFGKANVQAGAFVTEDMTEILNNDIARSNEIDNRIKELKKKDSEKNAEELKGLSDEKAAIEGKIEEIRFASDFVNVTIYLSKK